MDFKFLLFSFEGRTRRLHYWVVAILLWVVALIANTVLGTNAAMMAAVASRDPQVMAAAMSHSMGLASIVSLVLLWPSLANNIKRCHDRNKSGWWLIAYFLACLTIIGALWPLIELGFMDGTPGPNKYGPSPKGFGDPALTAA